VSVVELEVGRVAAYEVIGDGVPALLFPGGPGAAGSYMRKFAELSSSIFTNYLIDPHGSGGSTPPTSPDQYSPEGHARFYDEVRAALGLERVTVLGHSFGGGVALAYAALFPDATSTCICVAGFAIGADVDAAEGGEAAAEMEAMLSRHRSAEWYEDARATWETWTERVIAADGGSEVDQMMRTVLPLYAAHPERPDVWAGIEELRRDLTFDLVAAKAWEGGLYQNVDLRPLLPRISAPTLVLAGELDLICGPAQARRIAEAIPTAEVVLLPDCGHLLAVEAPTAYAKVVVDWARRHPEA